jgi:hypothetical protein
MKIIYGTPRNPVTPQQLEAIPQPDYTALLERIAVALEALKGTDKFADKPEFVVRLEDDFALAKKALRAIMAEVHPYPKDPIAYRVWLVAFSTLCLFDGFKFDGITEDEEKP